MSGYGYPPYGPVAERRLKAEQAMAKLRKQGRQLAPVRVEGRLIARSFWGKAWCENLEDYSDYANRLPRGRTYLRNGSVLDLQIHPGQVLAQVSGSSIYKVQVQVRPVAAAKWQALCADCGHGIASLVELLQGRFHQGVMALLCRQGSGLFPTPAEITLSCSCPDGAYLCKHVAAVLYGIGARLDLEPELLFVLRQVDSQDLLTHAASGLALAAPVVAAERVLAGDDLSELFGLELGDEPVLAPVVEAKGKRAARSKAGAVVAGGPKVEAIPAVPVKADKADKAVKVAALVKPVKSVKPVKPVKPAKAKPKPRPKGRPKTGILG